MLVPVQLDIPAEYVDGFLVEIPGCVIRFQNLFRAYLKEAQKGDLSVNTINSLLETLDEVEATQNGTVTIDFSTEELTTLLMQIYEYTNKLAAATSVSAESLSAPTRNSEGNLLSLKQYLHLQKQIIESAA